MNPIIVTGLIVGFLVGGPFGAFIAGAILILLYAFF